MAPRIAYDVKRYARSGRKVHPPPRHPRSVDRFRPRAPIAAASALVFRRDRVLLVKRRVEPNRGRWGLPGGAIELGEAARDTVVREAREETGLDVAVTRLVDVVDVIVPREDRPDFHYVLAVFRARPVGGRIRAASDAAEARWVRFSELRTLDLTDTTRAVIRTARRRHM